MVYTKDSVCFVQTVCIIYIQYKVARYDDLKNLFINHILVKKMRRIYRLLLLVDFKMVVNLSTNLVY